MRFKMLLTFFLLFFVGISLAGNQYFLDFDGSNDYVKYTDDATLGKMDGATDYTIEAWIYPVDGRVAEYDRVLQRYYSFAIVMYDGNSDGNVEDWYFQVYDKGSSSWKYFNTEGDATLTLNEWNHITVINNSSDGSLKLYVNGIDVTSAGGYPNQAMPSSSSNDNLYIGSLKASSPNNSFGGYIDEVRIKNVAEDINDIHFHKNDLEYTSDANTAALFHFDERSGQTTTNAASGSDAYLGTSTPGDAAEPTWRVWNYNGSDLSLPVELTTFSAFFAGHAVLLQWQTASEVENLGFIIERALQKDGPFNAIASYRDVPSLKGAGNSSQGHHYSYSDQTIQPGTNYWYRLQDVSLNGNRQTHGPIFVATIADNSVLQPGISQTIPRRFKLYANYPNPFNPDTRIKLDIPQNKDGNITLKAVIFDLSGRQVRSLYTGAIQAGTYQLHWDGKDNAGRQLGSGVYILSVKAGTYYNAIKMTLMR